MWRNFTANSIATDEDKRKILLSTRGAETYQLIRSLVVPLERYHPTGHEPPHSTFLCYCAIFSLSLAHSERRGNDWFHQPSHLTILQKSTWTLSRRKSCLWYLSSSWITSEKSQSTIKVDGSEHVWNGTLPGPPGLMSVYYKRLVYYRS